MILNYKYYIVDNFSNNNVVSNITYQEYSSDNFFDTTLLFAFLIFIFGFILIVVPLFIILLPDF